MSKELDDAIAKAKAAVAKMSPQEYDAMMEEQKRSFARAFAPCEHGMLDFEQCEQCRAKSDGNNSQ